MWCSFSWQKLSKFLHSLLCTFILIENVKLAAKVQGLRQHVFIFFGDGGQLEDVNIFLVYPE